MSKSIAVYIEGGGDTAQTLTPFRQGMSTFLKAFETTARSKGNRWRIIACGGRQAAYDAFTDALVQEPAVHNILLVDAEEKIAFGRSPKPWTHLKKRKGEGWDQPRGSGDDHCQLMTICMEAWFIADPDGLAKHFGKNFDRDKLPAANLAETRSKTEISSCLAKATKATAAKEYKKIRDGAKILAKINPATVQSHCKWCERLFKALDEAVK